MLNYSVDPELLRPYVPAGTEIDSFEGKTYLSLVGFEFNRTCISGIKVPFHGSFEEVNLRFYVKRGEKRGVVFIRELVPKFAVAAVARNAYGEKYSRVAMSHRIHYRLDRDAVEAEYSWDKGVSTCSMSIETNGSAFLPADGTLSQFITEHYWGYAAQRKTGTIEYEVQHAQWQVREGKTATVSGNTTRYFGADFAQVLMKPPDSSFLAEGSPVTVFKGARIE
jgi:uncharacterized protein